MPFNFLLKNNSLSFAFFERPSFFNIVNEFLHKLFNSCFLIEKFNRFHLHPRTHTHFRLILKYHHHLFNNEIVSFHIGQTPSAAEIQNALNEAIRVTSDSPYRSTFHSDKGAYQMKSYIKWLKEKRIFQRMSRKGKCLDNNVMENFFGLLKQEIYYGRVYHSYEELKTAIEKYIVYYSERRIKESLGWLSPAQYHRKHLAA